MLHHAMVYGLWLGVGDSEEGGRAGGSDPGLVRVAPRAVHLVRVAAGGSETAHEHVVGG